MLKVLLLSQFDFFNSVCVAGVLKIVSAIKLPMASVCVAGVSKIVSAIKLPTTYQYERPFSMGIG